MNNKPPHKLLYSLLFQSFLAVALMGGTEFCSGSNDSSNGNDDDDNNDTANLSLDGYCYSCTQAAGDGDTCGSEMISGTSSDFSFEEEESTTALSINDQIYLSGTFEEGSLALSTSRTEYVGPGCNMTFTNIQFTAEITSEEALREGWTGTLVYDLELDEEDTSCGIYSFSTCHAVHTTTCDAGC